MFTVYNAKGERYSIQKADRYEVSKDGVLCLYKGADLVEIWAAGMWSRCIGLNNSPADQSIRAAPELQRQP